MPLLDDVQVGFYVSCAVLYALDEAFCALAIQARPPATSEPCAWLAWNLRPLCLHFAYLCSLIFP